VIHLGGGYRENRAEKTSTYYVTKNGAGALEKRSIDQHRADLLKKRVSGKGNHSQKKREQALARGSQSEVGKMILR